MTNFQPFKDKIWEAAKSDDKQAFDEACLNLMEKAGEDIWRIGWEIYPKNIEDVYKLLDNLSTWCHERWLEAMKCGDAPPEDVSPGEGPMLMKRVIQEAIEMSGKSKKKKKAKQAK